MQTANQLLAKPLPTESADKPQPSSHGSTQKNSIEKLVTLLWARMTDLFGAKWISKSGDLVDDHGAYSPTFLLWCRKLDGLTPAEFKRGMDGLEERAKRAGQLGEEFWPPSYAEFIGLCTANWQTAAHKPFEKLALPDKTAQERARASGRRELDAMKAMFGDKPDLSSHDLNAGASPC